MSDRPGVTGKVVGPPLADQDAAELDELAREEREEAREATLVGDGEEEDSTLVAVGEEREPESEGDLDGELDTGVESAPDLWVLMRFIEVSLVLPATHPVLVLEEEDGGRQLRIPIGTPEGVAIAYAARQLTTARPLTHELTIDILEAYNLTVETVRITAVRGSAYDAEIVLSGPSGMQTLACRPSDGVALALRQSLIAPIVAAPDVLDAAGVTQRPR